MISLSDRVVACKGWRWMPGMLTQGGARVTSLFPSRVGDLPGLTDPATIGCLEHLVREAWAGWEVDILVSDTAWSVWPDKGTGDDSPFEAASLVEALVLALEAADAQS